jgi:acetoin:2,6-dichlorophenolindophenol oxidoreductase subunit beta
VPSDPYDAKGLMKTAIRDNNPVVFFYHKKLLGAKGMVPEEDYTIPLGVAAIKKEGTDVTVIATSYMVSLALDAAKELNGKISVEVVDPRTLEPLDLETILKSVRKTNRVVIVDEDTKRCGTAAELATQIMEKGFDYLDAPVQRVCAANMPIPGGSLEPYALPDVRQIVAAIETVTY